MSTADPLIHLLYVPTTYCNLGCSYCYLGEQTDTHLLKKDANRSLATLKFAVNKFQKAGVTPFNISLHGGEVTTLAGTQLRDLFAFITDYYHLNRTTLAAAGHNKNWPHVKTNLFNFDKHIDLFNEFKVSISASVDLPLSLHKKYRVSKRGTSTLERTLDNLRLLALYPHAKKLSAVLYDEHLTMLEAIVEDIWHLHNHIGLDMNKFNFMFGFESTWNEKKFSSSMPASDDIKQVEFYEYIKSAFSDTPLEHGLRNHWFEEFTPSFCTSAVNCGEKFFLLQSDGNVYSCVRGQGSTGFHYGNILTDSVEALLSRAEQKIQQAHQTQGLHEDCQQCEYLAICHSGCPFVKSQQNCAKSYTCALQKAIYRDDPQRFPARHGEEQTLALNDYVVEMHPHKVSATLTPLQPGISLPNDLYDSKNGLSAIIEQDPLLTLLYSSEQLLLEVDQSVITLESQLLKTQRPIVNIGEDSQVHLHLTRDFIQAACDDWHRNTVHLQLLRDTPVTYGDEQRNKQQHLYTLEIYLAQLNPSSILTDGYSVDLHPFLNLARGQFRSGVLNNLFITTFYLRRYHYEKQQSNGFYHIQALNLPFQNFEFYWLEKLNDE